MGVRPRHSTPGAVWSRALRVTTTISSLTMKLLAADASWEAANVAVQTFGVSAMKALYGIELTLASGALSGLTRVRQFAREIVDAVAAKGECDFVHDVAARALLGGLEQARRFTWRGSAVALVAARAARCWRPWWWPDT